MFYLELNLKQIEIKIDIIYIQINYPVSYIN